MVTRRSVDGANGGKARHFVVENVIVDIGDAEDKGFRAGSKNRKAD